MRDEERRVALGLAVAAAIALAFLPALIRTLLADHAYWNQIYVWVLFFAMCATAWNIIGGYARQYSFGHAAFLGIGAYVSTLLYLNLGVSPWIGMLAGGIAAALAGAIISYPCFRLRGAFFSLATIAFAEMLRVWGELTDRLFGILVNGARGLVIPPVGSDFWAFQFTEKASYAYVAYTLLLITLTIAWAVKRSRLGYYLAAIGDDEEAVQSLGVDTARIKLIALLISAFLTAVAGTFYAQLVLFITPTRAISLDLSVQMVIMAVMGGLGTVFGPLLGAIILVPVGELTRAALGGSTLQGAHLIVYGVILMLVVRFAPKGIEAFVAGAFRRLIAAIADRLYGPAKAQDDVVNAPIIQLPEASSSLGLQAVAGGAVPLVLADVTKRFGGAVGVKGVSLTVQPGEVVGLIGPNGSGKTTIFNLVTGYLESQSGSIAFAGRPIAGLPPHRINRLGIARTFQIVRPFTSLTVAENVMVAAFPRCTTAAAARTEALRCLAFVGLSHRVDTIADGLSTGERKRLELARALATRPRLLLMDEVMGGLDQRSLPAMIDLVQRIRAEGISLLIIEHKLKVITSVTDRIVMLHLGEKIREGAACEVVSDPLVIDIYVGGAAAVR
ncbi:MAG: branched-chain amino acid ABC transporter ATP-binding protein/permease [Alphaproteobacteria bacterium]|nr:branched-chain amino acid ABC transporter ATP-binding protein/permease [Alphaproteobacteria bacterium]